jgi:hypothetical protein
VGVYIVDDFFNGVDGPAMPNSFGTYHSVEKIPLGIASNQIDHERPQYPHDPYALAGIKAVLESRPCPKRGRFP